jgi:glycogen synthase
MDLSKGYATKKSRSSGVNKGLQLKSVLRYRVNTKSGIQNEIEAMLYLSNSDRCHFT